MKKIKKRYSYIFVFTGLVFLMTRQDSFGQDTLVELNFSSQYKNHFGTSLTVAQTRTFGHTISWSAGITGNFKLDNCRLLSLEGELLFSNRNLVQKGFDPWENQDVNNYHNTYNYTLSHQVIEVPFFLKFRPHFSLNKRINPYFSLGTAVTFLISGKLSYIDSTVTTIPTTKYFRIGDKKNNEVFTPGFDQCWMARIGIDYSRISLSVQYQFGIGSIGPNLFHDQGSTYIHVNHYKAISIKLIVYFK